MVSSKVEAIENVGSVILGAGGAYAFEWGAVMGSAITAAVVGVVGGFCGLAGKWLWKKLLERFDMKRKQKKNTNKI